MAGDIYWWKLNFHNRFYWGFRAEVSNEFDSTTVKLGQARSGSRYGNFFFFIFPENIIEKRYLPSEAQKFKNATAKIRDKNPSFFLKIFFIQWKKWFKKCKTSQIVFFINSFNYSNQFFSLCFWNSHVLRDLERELYNFDFDIKYIYLFF